MPNPRPTSWRVNLMSGSVIVAVVLGLLAAAYLLIQTFVGSIGWSRLVTRTSDETHSQICRDDAGRTSARPAHGRDCCVYRKLRAIHSAVGLVVTLIQTRSLRSIRTITKPYSGLKPMVGTTNKSMAAMSGAWFRKKVFHP